VFSSRFAQRGYKEGNWGVPVSCELSSVWEAVKRWRYSSVDSSVVEYSPNSHDVSTEAEESPLLRAVTKQRLAKTLQAGEDFSV
jgi:hypothetical protein